MRRPPVSHRVSGVALLAAALAVALATAPAPASAVGSDPGLPQQWGLRQIGAPAAWSTSVGAGVPIAIVDTGIDLGHEDLHDQIAAAVTCVNTGGDPAKCVTDGQDIAGHGSHVAGIAAAASNDVGVAGVAPGARLVAVRVFTKTSDPINGDSFGANTDDINAGIRWAIHHVAGKGVINLSIGDDLPVALGSAGFSDGVEEAWAAGWATALAAGNEGNLLGLNGEDYGDLDAVVVGATGPTGAVASYSSPIGDAKWGVVAPGGDTSSCEKEPAKCVLSTYLGGKYAFLEGTSMATPHVAGGLALLMAAGLSNQAAVQRLLATLDSSKTCGSGCKGRLDVAKAVSGLAPAGGGGGGGGGTTAPPTSSASPATTGRAPGTTARRPVSGSTGATTAPAGATTSAVAAPGPSVDVSSTTSSTVAGDVQPLSIDQAADAVGGSGGNDDDHGGVPVVAIALGLAALVGVAVPTVLLARRRAVRGDAGP